MHDVLAACLLATTASCSLLASANAKHSHVTPCVDTSAFGVVDIVVAAAGGALIAVTVVDDAPWALALPGAFFLSGLYGVISADSCKADAKNQPTAAPIIYVGDPTVDAPGAEEKPAADLPCFAPDWRCGEHQSCVRLADERGTCVSDE